MRPVVAMPWIRVRWNITNRSRTGARVRLAMANMADQSEVPLESRKDRKSVV